ncbi:hypothetical protein PsYK624_138940 [Phanerochaete sordida]|uniref:Uncharacterized protein n=1 Tax=Phanerochaete sordida TaxID=48140 RepID=A0A9P3GMI0_9APHY|nr:hypothetical protein PsYK624_138940 [Phanerochaete sordida]
MAVRLASASQARCRWQRYLPAASPARMMCIMAVIPSRGPVDDRSGSSLPHRRAGGAWRGRGGTEIWMLIPFAIVHDRMRIGDGRAAGTLPP